MPHLTLMDLKSRMAKGWIKKAIKHPGIEKERAKEHGISTHEQLERDARSSNPTLRARGNLGLRFQKGGDLNRKRKSRGQVLYDKD